MQASQPRIRQLKLQVSPATASPRAVRDDEVEEARPSEQLPLQRAVEARWYQAQAGDLDLPVPVSERVALALSASRRAEANLRALYRTVKFLSASLAAAHESNDQLLRELAQLHDALGEEESYQLAHPGAANASGEARATLLEQALNDTTEQAVREREYLIADHDAFIASLLADHDKEMYRLRRRVAEAEAKLAAREADDFGRGLMEDDQRIARV